MKQKEKMKRRWYGVKNGGSNRFSDASISTYSAARSATLINESSSGGRILGIAYLLGGQSVTRRVYDILQSRGGRVKSNISRGERRKNEKVLLTRSNFETFQIPVLAGNEFYRTRRAIFSYATRPVLPPSRTKFRIQQRENNF